MWLPAKVSVPQCRPWTLAMLGVLDATNPIVADPSIRPASQQKFCCGLLCFVRIVHLTGTHKIQMSVFHCRRRLWSAPLTQPGFALSRGDVPCTWFVASMAGLILKCSDLRPMSLDPH